MRRDLGSHRRRPSPGVALHRLMIALAGDNYQPKHLKNSLPEEDKEITQDDRSGVL